MRHVCQTRRENTFHEDYLPVSQEEGSSCNADPVWCPERLKVALLRPAARQLFICLAHQVTLEEEEGGGRGITNGCTASVLLIRPLQVVSDGLLIYSLMIKLLLRISLKKSSEISVGLRRILKVLRCLKSSSS